jgi:hypothetical protein
VISFASEKWNEKPQLANHARKTEEKRKMRNRSMISKDHTNWGRDCEHKHRSERNDWTIGSFQKRKIDQNATSLPQHVSHALDNYVFNAISVKHCWECHDEKKLWLLTPFSVI